MKWKKINSFFTEIYGRQNINQIKCKAWLDMLQIEFWQDNFSVECINRMHLDLHRIKSLPPRIDHKILFKTIKNEIYLVYNTYFNYNELLKELENWNLDEKLIINIQRDSWYKETILVTIQIA